MTTIAYHGFTAFPRYLRKLARLLRFKPEENIDKVKKNLDCGDYPIPKNQCVPR